MEGAAFARRLVTAKHLCETILATYKEVLRENPDDLPGFILKPGKSKREIRDLPAAFEALDGAIDLNGFLSCANVSVAKLQELYGKTLAIKGKALRERFNARLEAVIDWKTDAPSLEDTQS
jgi:hypothetical protein